LNAEKYQEIIYTAIIHSYEIQAYTLLFAPDISRYTAFHYYYKQVAQLSLTNPRIALHHD